MVKRRRNISAVFILYIIETNSNTIYGFYTAL